METQALQLFIDVTAAGSFAAAARRHNIDPSSVSRTIAALEEELQIRLFQRSTRKLALTEAGSRYYQRCKPLLESLNEAQEEAQTLTHTPSGTLRMTASVAFGQECLIPHLERFQKDYPDIHLDLQLTDKNLDLYAEDIDLACRLTPEFESNLIGTKLFDTQYYVVASPKYLKQQKVQLKALQNKNCFEKPEDLSTASCLTFNLPEYKTLWKFRDKQGQDTEVPIQSKLSISSILGLRRCTVNGLGPTLLADWVVKKELKSGELVNLFPQYQATATDFQTAAWLLFPSRKYVPTKTRVMVDFLKTVYSNTP